MATIFIRRLVATAAQALRTYNAELLAQQLQQQTAALSTSLALGKKKSSKCLSPLEKCKKSNKKCKKQLKKAKLALKCAKLAAKKKKKKKAPAKGKGKK